MTEARLIVELPGSSDPQPEEPREIESEMEAAVARAEDRPPRGTVVCGPSTTPAVVEKLTALLHCCYGAMRGLDSCTCWTPIYDRDQQDPVPLPAGFDAATREEMCVDCAYRPDSPERTGSEHVAHTDDGELDYIARNSTFWCHQGMRKIVAWRHDKLGITIEQYDGVDNYGAPLVHGDDGLPTPLKVDGTPGERCAGWSARKRQLEALAASYDE